MSTREEKRRLRSSFRARHIKQRGLSHSVDRTLLVVIKNLSALFELVRETTPRHSCAEFENCSIQAVRPSANTQPFDDEGGRMPKNVSLDGLELTGGVYMIGETSQLRSFS